MIRRLIAATLIVAGLTLSACDEGGPIKVEVDGLDIEQLGWGEHEFSMKISSRSENLHFIVINTETDFPGLYGSAQRSTRINSLILPGEEVQLSPSLLVPNNYGTASVSITVYDVVDTLDILMPKYICWQEQRQLTFDPPDEIGPYREFPIQLPPRVADHPYFDNELSRLLLVLLNEGKTVPEIAGLTGADTGLVNEVLAQMMSRKHVQQTDRGLEVLVPVMSHKQILATLPLVDSLVDTLATLVHHNWDAFLKTRDSLVRAGLMSADSNLTMHAGGALYDRFTTIGALLLWNEWGRRFITRSAPLVIFDGTDPCDANIGVYMYLAIASRDQTGEHYFIQNLGRGGYSMNFADWPLGMVCEEQFLRKVERGSRVNWSFNDNSRPLNHAFDTSVTGVAVRTLAAGCDTLLWRTYENARDTAVAYGQARLDFGQRYWFWNLTATRVLKRLVDEGFVDRPESGHVRLQAYRGRGRRG